MASSANQMRTWRGADRAEDNCVVDPLCSIRHGLILSGLADIPARPTWQDVIEAGRGHALEDYAKLVRTKRVFAVGGLQLLIECGLVNDWYRNKANRELALKLIKDRGHRDLLDRLGDKETADSIFGQNDLRAYFQHFPPVKRTNGQKKSKAPPGVRTIRKEFPLRLRKALEFLYLTEAVLRWRFSINETKQRFQELTGHAVKGEDDARRIWDYMWIEPLLFVVDPEPRSPDVRRIVAQQTGAPRQFEVASGQHPSVLNSILRGVPGSYDVVAAAGPACDHFYPEGADKTLAVTVAVDQHDRRLGRLQDDPLFSEGATSIENIVQLTPHP